MLPYLHPSSPLRAQVLAPITALALAHPLQSGSVALPASFPGPTWTARPGSSFFHGRRSPPLPAAGRRPSLHRLPCLVRDELAQPQFIHGAGNNNPLPWTPSPPCSALGADAPFLHFFSAALLSALIFTAMIQRRCQIWSPSRQQLPLSCPCTPLVQPLPGARRNGHVELCIVCSPICDTVALSF
jgi:hypothetical protein